MSGIEDPRPRFQRIIEFPLVAMLIAILLFAFAAALAIVFKSNLPAIGHGTKQAVETVITVALGLAAYKLAIRHLGAGPRDDLRAGDLVRNLTIGILIGAGLMALIVAIARARSS